MPNYGRNKKNNNNKKTCVWDEAYCCRAVLFQLLSVPPAPLLARLTRWKKKYHVVCTSSTQYHKNKITGYRLHGTRDGKHCTSYVLYNLAIRRFEKRKKSKNHVDPYLGLVHRATFCTFTYDTAVHNLVTTVGLVEEKHRTYITLGEAKPLKQSNSSGEIKPEIAGARFEFFHTSSRADHKILNPPLHDAT